MALIMLELVGLSAADLTISSFSSTVLHLQVYCSRLRMLYYYLIYGGRQLTGENSVFFVHAWLPI